MPPARLVVSLLTDGVTLILGLKFVFTIGADRVDCGDMCSSTDVAPFKRQILLPHLTIAILKMIMLTRYRMG